MINSIQINDKEENQESVKAYKQGNLPALPILGDNDLS